MKHLFLLLLAFLLGGCAATQSPPPDHSALLADALFKPPTDKITADDLFKVSPAMKEYLRSQDFRRLSAMRGGALGLIDALYSRDQLQLAYDTTATRSAAETFESKSGNCLSLVIMTAAFARELGLVPTFQAVLTGDTWTRSGELYLSAMHVNMLVGRRAPKVNEIDERGGQLVVDFLPPDQVKGYATRRIDEAMVVAMYLNNRAAEALTENRLDDAYWWARKAVTGQPDYAPALNTLGVVYQRRGQPALAERAYQMALAQDPHSDATMYNLVPLLAQLGRHAESQAIAARVSAIRKVPPFHYYLSGIEAMQRADYALARDMFRKEVERAPYYDEFHYWLGMAQLRLGDAGAARAQFALALENSTTDGSRSKYSAKLRHMKASGGGKL